MLLFTSCKNVSDTDINSEYIPTLAKTSETQSIKIYDLKNEKRYAMINDEGLELQEMYLAIFSIQGIVNRTSPEKIYFINSPNGTFDELKVIY